jgi:hypothetical protein
MPISQTAMSNLRTIYVSSLLFCLLSIPFVYAALHIVFQQLFTITELQMEDSKQVFPQLLLVLTFLLSILLPLLLIPFMLCCIPFLHALLHTMVHYLFWWKKHDRARSSLIVVITGCDSGFGLMTAKELTKLGYTVVAGCLNAASPGAQVKRV